MIFEEIFKFFLMLIKNLMNTLDVIPSVVISIADIISLLSKGLYFVNTTVFFTCISVVLGCMTIELGFALGMFVIKKIPFISIQ